MNVGALVAGGVPPLGLGVFTRDSITRGPWRYAAINAGRSDVAQQAQQVHELGLDLWLYQTPDAWAPSTWAATRARIRQMVAPLGAQGYMADAESAWPGLSSTTRRTQLTALGQALAADAIDMRVGFSSYPLFPDLEVLAAAAGSLVFGVPQEYHASNAAGFGVWFQHWHDLFGTRVIPAIAAWAADPSQGNLAGYTAYLAQLPHAAGAIAWEGAGTPPAYVLQALSSYQPGGSFVGTLSQQLEVLVLRPWVLVAVAFVVFVVIAAVALGGRHGA